MGFLIDTCIWVDVERGVFGPADVATVTGNEPVYISPVTIAELKFGAENAADAGIRQRRLAALARLKRKPLLTIDEMTGEIFGDLAVHGLDLRFQVGGVDLHGHGRVLRWMMR